MYAGRAALDSLPDLKSTARDQAWVVSRTQLSAAGVNHRAVTRHIEAGRWASLSPLVIVLHRGPLTTEAKRWAAVLNGGQLSALCSWTALQQWGLRGWDRDLVHLVVPRGTAPTPLPWVRVHESRRHSAADVVRCPGGPPTHEAARAAIDTAAWERSLRTGCGLLAATVQQRLASVSSLLMALEQAGRVRHRRVLAATLQDISGGADALSEIDFARLCADAGLPAPRRQAIRTDLRGRRRYRDVEWTREDGRIVVCEIDGMGHLEVSRWYDDLMRDAELTKSEADEIRFRLPAIAIRTERRRVIAILTSVLLP